MQRLEVSGAVRPIYGSLGVKRLMFSPTLRLLSYSHLFHIPCVGFRISLIVLFRNAGKT